MPSTFEIRPARREEAAVVADALEWLFVPPGGPPPEWDRRRATTALAAAIGDPRASVFVADDGELVGLCTVYLDLDSARMGRRAWVEDLAVHAQRRSLGIGKALLDAAKDWAREHRGTHLELDSAEARSDAHRFYQREQPSWRSACFGWRL